MPHEWVEQRLRLDDGSVKLHRERPSRRLGLCRLLGTTAEWGEEWENDLYYGCLRHHASGFPVGGGPWALLSISRLDETAAHDFRDFQRIKNDLLGPEWEAVELYPAESRLRDPSNRFYLWCVPKGVFNFGFEDRLVLDIDKAIAPQRAFPRE